MSSEHEATELQVMADGLVYLPTGAMDSLLITLQKTMDGVIDGSLSTGQAFAISKVANSQTKSLELAFRIYKEIAGSDK